MLDKKRVWIGVLIVVALVAAGAYYYTTTTAVSAIDEESAELQTATVRQGDITISVTGAGTVIPVTQIDLSFATSGVLDELLVNIGDKVQEGDVLARLNDTSALQNLLDAELQVAEAVMQTDGSTTAAGVSFQDIRIEQTMLSLTAAQNSLDDLLNWQPDENEIALAEANLTAAEASYNAARGSEASTYSNVQVSGINLEAAQRSLADAQAAYDTAWDPGREWELGVDRMKTALENERESATNSLQRAQDDLAIAQAQYSGTVSSSNSSSSTNAQSSIISAEQAVLAAQTGPIDEEIQAAETAVRQAELAYQEALLNQETAVLNLSQSQLNLESAQAAVDDTVLTAPMDGVIMAVGGNEGETIASGSFITLADLDQPMLEVYMDESDLGTIGVDYEVEVSFDALPDELFSGQVTQVDPQLSEVSGVTVVRAFVQLDADSFAKPQTFPVGMNATVEVIGGQAQNTLLVPVESLREISPGQFALFVMVDGEPELRMVDVGLMDFTYAEILSGVEAGDMVTTGIVQTN